MPGWYRTENSNNSWWKRRGVKTLENLECRCLDNINKKGGKYLEIHWRGIKVFRRGVRRPRKGLSLSDGKAKKFLWPRYTLSTPQLVERKQRE